jgi:trans-aconitate 2-methyltransferase
MSDAWDPNQYDRFREERQQPFYDLLKLVIPKKSMRVLDLGCGTGELTREMHRHFKAAHTLGVDSSDAMMERARDVVEPGLAFERGRIEDFHVDDGAFDLVLSNAALHWVDDHEAVLARLTRALAPGGQLAVQMPANQDHPSHVVAAALAKDPEFAQALGGEGARQHVLPVEQYAKLLARLGFRQHNVRTQVYVHKLPSAAGVVEWVKGAMLTDFKKRLDDAQYARFLARYSDALLAQLDDEKPYLYTFKRILFAAERA